MNQLNSIFGMRLGYATIIFCLVCLVAAPIEADIYYFVSRDGVAHFTNIPETRHPWRRIMKTGPGKAGVVHAARRGARGAPERYSRYDDYISAAADLYDLPESLVRAVISVESDYDEQAVSNVGARGLMQLMPHTASDLGVTDIFDPYQNIFGGARYLRMLANRFEGDLEHTIAGYHAGPGAVEKYGGIPPYQTTQTYVDLVIARYRAASDS